MVDLPPTASEAFKTFFNSRAAAAFKSLNRSYLCTARIISGSLRPCYLEPGLPSTETAGVLTNLGVRRTHTILAERDAVFEQREAVFPAIDGHATSWQIDEIFSEVSRMDCEGDLERLRGLTDEVPFAKLHGETLAAFAQDDRDQGTARMHEYTQLMAANEYLEYRNVSLWELMCALVRHRDAGWVQNLLLDVVAAALAGSDRPFIGGSGMRFGFCRPSRKAEVDLSLKRGWRTPGIRLLSATSGARPCDALAASPIQSCSFC